MPTSARLSLTCACCMLMPGQWAARGQSPMLSHLSPLLGFKRRAFRIYPGLLFSLSCCLCRVSPFHILVYLERDVIDETEALPNTNSVTENGCLHALSHMFSGLQTTLAGKQAPEVLPNGFEVSFAQQARLLLSSEPHPHPPKTVKLYFNFIDYSVTLEKSIRHRRKYN